MTRVSRRLPIAFYIPGQYYPDKDGVVWKKGFWAKVQPGWAWVPAQWIRQPEGWTFQEGYWDRTLEDRGTLFAPAEVDKSAKTTDDLTYQPYTKVSPEMYGQIYGGFGRPNSYYDGYPGVYYDDSGRFYGYANYGNIGGYYGYLDYPYYGGNGYPYYAQPINYGYDGYGYGGYGGYGLCGGLLSSIYGFGLWISLLRHVRAGWLRRIWVRVPLLRRFGYGGRGTAVSATAAWGTAVSAMAAWGTVVSATAGLGYGGFGLGWASAASGWAWLWISLLRFWLWLSRSGAGVAAAVAWLWRLWLWSRRLWLGTRRLGLGSWRLGWWLGTFLSLWRREGLWGGWLERDCVVGQG